MVFLVGHFIIGRSCDPADTNVFYLTTSPIDIYLCRARMKNGRLAFRASLSSCTSWAQRECANLQKMHRMTEDEVRSILHVPGVGEAAIGAICSCALSTGLHVEGISLLPCNLQLRITLSAQDMRIVRKQIQSPFIDNISAFDDILDRGDYVPIHLPFHDDTLATPKPGELYVYTQSVCPPQCTAFVILEFALAWTPTNVESRSLTSPLTTSQFEDAYTDGGVAFKQGVCLSAYGAQICHHRLTGLRRIHDMIWAVTYELLNLDPNGARFAFVHDHD